jgi:hypothetical protein
MSNQSSKMWSGRFREPLNAAFEQWQRSFPFDWRLLPHEVAASKAHARAIAAAGILSSAKPSSPPCSTASMPSSRRQPIDGPTVVASAPNAEDIHHFAELPTDEAHRRSRAQAAHRPQPQRADRDGHAAYSCARQSTYDRGIARTGRSRWLILRLQRVMP